MVERHRYPPLTDELQSRGLRSLLLLFGPGAIIASVTIGSGETVFASRGGALFGYALLWCFVGGGVMKFVQVYTAARYITLTGEHPIERWRYVPGPRNWAVWFLASITILCFPMWLSGLPKMLGQVSVWIFGFDGQAFWGDARVWGTTYVGIAITLTLVQSYAALERFQTVVVGVLLLCIVVAAIVVQPDWVTVFYHLFVPSLPDYEPWVVDRYPSFAARSPWIEIGVYLGAIGGGTQDYFGYIGMLREKGWGLLRKRVDAGPNGVLLAVDDANLQLGRRWLRAPLTDVLVSFSCIVLFTVAFMILGATVLHPQQLVPADDRLLSVQAEFLTLLHPNLLYVYQFGVLMAFFGTIVGAYELYTRTSHEVLRPLFACIRRMSLQQIRPWVVAYCGVGGVAIMWLGGNPVAIVTPAAIFGSLLTCGLWCLLMVWTDRCFLPKPLRMGSGLLLLNVVSGLFLTLWGLRSIFDFVTGQ